MWHVSDIWMCYHSHSHSHSHSHLIWILFFLPPLLLLWLGTRCGSFIYFLAMRLLLVINDRWPKKLQSWYNVLWESLSLSLYLSHLCFLSVSLSQKHDNNKNKTNILQVSRNPLVSLAIVTCISISLSLSALLGVSIHALSLSQSALLQQFWRAFALSELCARWVWNRGARNAQLTGTRVWNVSLINIFN